MKRLGFALLLVVSPVVGCYSGSGGGDHENGAGGFSSGASAGSGAFSNGGASAGSGAFSSGGTSRGGASSGGIGGDECGACPGAACLAGLWLTVAPDPAELHLEDLSVQVDGLTVTCTSGGATCDYYCQSAEYYFPDGHYTVTISAPGFQTQTLEFDAVAPTNCGCCGCCPFSYSDQVTLVSDGSAAVGACCGDTDTDPQNCGSCGHVCPGGTACTAGACGPVFAGCLTDSSGYANCTDYCAASGQVCAAACGTVPTASREYNGNLDCSDAAATVLDSTDCAAPFVVGNALRSYQCCCAAP